MKKVNRLVILGCNLVVLKKKVREYEEKSLYSLFMLVGVKPFLYSLT